MGVVHNVGISNEILPEGTFKMDSNQKGKDLQTKNCIVEDSDERAKVSHG